jgi:ABC-type transport system involved in multi-copper enzyme maturation permease subunit
VEHPVLPSDFTQFWTSFRYQLKLYLRSTRFYVFFGILAGLGTILATVVAYRGPAGPTASTFLQGGFGFVSVFFVVTLAVVFGGDVASIDLGTAAGFYVLPLPVRRTTLLLGRIWAAFLAGFACLCVFVLGLVGVALFRYVSFPVGPFFAAVGLAALALGAALLVTVFFSTLFRHNAYGFVLSFIVLFVVSNVASTLLSLYASIPSWWSLPDAASVLKLPFGAATAGSTPDYVHGIGSLSGYLLGFGLMALLVFRSREIGP